MERDDTKNKRREEGGEGEEGEADKRKEPGLEHPGKTCTRTGTSGLWRPWTESSGVEAALERSGLHKEGEAAAARDGKENMNKSKERWRARTQKIRAGKGEEKERK